MARHVLRSRQETIALLWQQGRHRELLQACAETLRSEPGNADLLSLFAVSSAVTGDFAGAQRALERALQIRPGDPVLLNNLGNVLRESGDPQGALAVYEKAVRAAPAYADAHYNLGLALMRTGRASEALASYRRAVDLNPNLAEAHYNIGNLCRESGRNSAAIAAYEQAIARKPMLAEAHNNLGALYTQVGEAAKAVPVLREAVRLRSHWAEAHANLGIALQDAREFPGALESFRTAIALDSNQKAARVRAIHCERSMCDWRSGSDSRAGSDSRTGSAELDGLLEQATPFSLLGLSDDPGKLLLAARAHSGRQQVVGPPLWSGERYEHQKIRLAYLSADFHTHATAFLVAELLELHDRSAFEVIGVSFGPDDGSVMRARLRAAFDRFVDVREWADQETAQWLRDQEIDIAIDLKGHTREARPRIFAHRPAPIQVNYLGYPGSMGAGFMDYIVADETLIPPEHRAYYDEQVVYLPDSYQSNDRQRLIAPSAPTRKAAGLPADGFVFCSFNSSWKITPDVFAVWMRLLAATPQSVLWLIEDNRWAVDNLRREALAQGVDPGRLVFAARTANPDHLARHALADLFLDTLPCGAHTTASDALWAGLPVLTCLGGSFAGRVAASLVRAVGMSDFVTDSLEEYERRALQLARAPQELEQRRRELQGGRLGHRLFDTERFCRRLESAYRTMWMRYQQGELPQGFHVGE